MHIISAIPTQEREDDIKELSLRGGSQGISVTHAEGSESSVDLLGEALAVETDMMFIVYSL